MIPDAPRNGLQAAIIGFAVRFRGVVAALSLLMLGIGVVSLFQARYDVFPEFAPPQVGIQTEAPGLTAEQIEALVTRPIENAVNGVPGVESLFSTSVQGLSVVTVTFEAGSDIYRDRQVVAERLAEAAQELPTGVKPPNMTPLTSSTSTVSVVGLTSDTRSLMDQRGAADWVMKPQLLAVPGVAKVAVFGGDERSIQIQVDPDQLIRYDLGLADVLTAARGATGVRGAGFIETANQRIVVQTEGQALTPEDVGRTVIVSNGGASVLLSDVARVVDAPEPPIGGATVMGKPGVVLMISAQYGANTVEVNERVQAALASLRPALERDGIELRDDLFRSADFIQTSTRNVRNALLLGGVLVIVVLFLFLYDLRTAAISCLAIPLSLLAAVAVLNALGATLNAMTLGGLAIAIGEVVDDAVIDVENIVRRLRENRRLAQPRSAAVVVIDASLEVRGAVVYATFAVVLVFLPVLTLPGIAGRFFAPLGLAYVLAIVASLIVALTATPALCMLLLGKDRGADGRRDVLDRDLPIAHWLRGRYERVLARLMRRPRAVIAATIAFTLGGCALLPFFGGALLPELREAHLIVHMSAVPGTSIEESLRLGTEVTKALTALPVVRAVGQHAGRAEKADDTWGTHYSEFEVDLLPDLSGDEMEAAQTAVRGALEGFPGVVFSVKTFLTERIEETLSGYTASVAINLFGNDLDALDDAARQIARTLQAVPGAVDVQLQSPPGMPQLTIELRRRDLERWGLRSDEVLQMVGAAYQGEVVGQSYDGNRVFDVIVRLDEASRTSVAKVGSLPLRTSDGHHVTLDQVADIRQGSGRFQIQHLGAQRVQTVTANVRGRDVGSFVADAKAAVAGRVTLPAGVFLEYAGSAAAQEAAQRNLLFSSAVAALGIVLLLSIVMGSARNLLLVLANLPFALVGGVLAVFFSTGVLTLGSLVGFVTLFGITLRNSIMMVSHYEHLVGAEGRRWSRELAVEGAGDRMSPIVMTSLVTGLGLLPLALGANDPGRELEGPMALVILGGLTSSMTLNLLVMPVLAYRYGRFDASDADYVSGDRSPAEIAAP